MTLRGETVRRSSGASLVLFAVLIAGCASPNEPTLSPAPRPTSTALAQQPSPTATADPLFLLLQAAVARTIEAGTARIERTVEYSGNSEIPDGLYISASGRITLSGTRQMVGGADFLGPGYGAVQLMLHDDLVLVSGPYFDEAIGPGKWLVVDLTSSDPRAANFRFLAAEHQHPLVLLYGLHGAMGIRELGTEPLFGLLTTHYAMQVDFVAAADSAPEDLREPMRSNRANAVAAGWDPISNADVWLDGEGRVRAVQLLERAGPAAGGGQLRVIIRYDGFGQPLDIEIPAEGDLVYLEDVTTPSPSPG